MCVLCVGWAFGFSKVFLLRILLRPILPRNRPRNSQGISRGTGPETPGRSPAGPGPTLPGNLLRARDQTSCGIWPDPVQGLRFAPKNPIKFRPYTHLYNNHSYARSAREIFWRLMPTPSSFPLHARSARKFFEVMPTPTSSPFYARSTRKMFEILPTPSSSPLHARSARKFFEVTNAQPRL